MVQFHSDWAKRQDFFEVLVKINVRVKLLKTYQGSLDKKLQA